MRLSLRFLVPLAIALGLVAYAVTPLVDRFMVQWFVNDLDLRSKLIVSTLDQDLFTVIDERSRNQIQAFFDRIAQDERIYALGFCDPKQKVGYKTERFPAELTCPPPEAMGESSMSVVNLPDGPIHVAFHPVQGSGRLLGQAVLVHDMSFVRTRSDETRRAILAFFIVVAALIAVITVAIAQWSWRGWVSGTRALLRGEGLLRPLAPTMAQPEMQPIVHDLRELIRDLETERRLRDETQTTWNPRTLKDLLRKELAGDEVIVVSNREPYIHVKREDGGVQVRTPASGLVTALEPVMRACSGTWIAHGSGSADRDVVDGYDRVSVPPDHPTYKLRRIWLTPEEERHYYYGFSNEGLWPLCHIAHVRPTFRSADWKEYLRVNEKFAKAVVEESRTSDPVILVQDYLLAALPRMLRKQLPNATIITFWHIPWPNPEAFGICPWAEEILDGLLGSSIVGFHTRHHGNNFVDTVERFLECRVDREHSTISYKGELSAVNRYPISIEFPHPALRQAKSVPDARAEIRARYGLPEKHKLGVGIDRLDYIKGIEEKFLAVERLLEQHPEWVGTFSFVQIAAPSRSGIPEYGRLERTVREAAERVNGRFSKAKRPPIILSIEHEERNSIVDHYRAADVCFVGSLHDGMNLVAKEFVSTRDDEQGVLILSQFTGASRELTEAIIVNPYHIDQCAAALHAALTMKSLEQRDRMRSMRGVLRDFNVYRWAGRMLIDAARMRQRNRFLARVGATDWDAGLGTSASET